MGSFQTASSLGILANGTDQTANLNSALANSAITGIIFDYSPPSAAVTVNGVVAANGKVFQFLNGSTIIGSGTINAVTIDAGYEQQIFSPTLTVNPSGVTREKFSAMWFGADRTGGADSKPAIQAAIDCVIRNNANLKTIFFPCGTYTINSQLIAQNWTGTNYTFLTINLEGETSYGEAFSGSKIIANFKNTFALGIQLGKGCKVKNLYIQGGFTPPFTSGFNFYSCTFDNFKDATCNDNTNAPYSAIVIDPFSLTSSQIPVGGGYPGLSSFYRGTGGNGGSTAIEIEDVFILGFVVGICLGPSGFTRNNEVHKFHKLQFRNCKLCISGNSDQDRTNVVEQVFCWGGTHTIFATGLYGAQTPGNWNISHLNVAGVVNQIVYNNEGGYYPSYFSNLNCESLGKFGTLSGEQPSVVENSSFDFASYDTISGLVDWHAEIFGGVITFKSCSLRMYGTRKPVSIKGRCIFENCVFEAIPYVQTNGNALYWQNDLPRFIDCTANSYALGLTGEHISNMAAVSDVLCSAYGDFSLYDGVSYNNTYIKKSRKFEGAPLYSFVHDGVAATISVTGANRQFTFVVPNVAGQGIAFFPIGSLICWSNGSSPYAPAGIITGVNTSTSTVTVSNAAISLPNGNVSLNVPFFINANAPFIGDVTASSNQITNVSADFGSDLSTLVGTVIRPYSNGTGVYNPYVLITAWNSTTKSLTMSSNSLYTQVGLYFSNYGTKSVEALGVNQGILGTELLQEGGWISTVRYANVDGRPRRFKVTKSGYFDSTAVGGGETRRALFVPEGQPFEYSGNPEGIVPFPVGVTVRDTTTNNLYIKAIDDYTQFNGGTTGWRKYVDFVTTTQVSAAALTLSAGTRTNVFNGTAIATWTLPSIAGNKGVEFVIKNRGSATLTVQRSGANQIYNTSAVNSVAVTAGQTLRLVNDGTFWDVF
jgi:hypothetical protein